MSLILKKSFFYGFFKRNNGAAMAVLAAPLPVALILLHSTASNFNSLSCPDAAVTHSGWKNRKRVSGVFVTGE